MVVVVTTQWNVLVPAMWVLWSRGASKAALLELVHGVRARVGQYRGASAVFGIIAFLLCLVLIRIILSPLVGRSDAGGGKKCGYISIDISQIRVLNAVISLMRGVWVLGIF